MVASVSGESWLPVPVAGFLWATRDEEKGGPRGKGPSTCLCWAEPLKSLSPSNALSKII